MKTIGLWSLLIIAPLGTASAQVNAQVQEETTEQQQTAVDSSEGDNSKENPNMVPGNSTTNGGPENSPTPKTDQTSPFDYNPSEEISEDLSVSFPVDI